MNVGLLSLFKIWIYVELEYLVKTLGKGVSTIHYSGSKFNFVRIITNPTVSSKVLVASVPFPLIGSSVHDVRIDLTDT